MVSLVKTLVLVDIQREFEKDGQVRLFGSRYIEEIMNFIKEKGIEKLVWIVDANQKTISLPVGLASLEQFIPTEVYWKNYAVMEILPQAVLEEFKGKFFKEEPNGQAFRAKGSNEVFVKTGNHHVFQEVTQQVKLFVDSVKEDEVYLIGGAEKECLQDIEKVLEYYHIPFQKEPKLIYPVPYTDHPIYQWLEKESPNPKGDFYLF